MLLFGKELNIRNDFNKLTTVILLNIEFKISVEMLTKKLAIVIETLIGKT